MKKAILISLVFSLLASFNASARINHDNLLVISVEKLFLFQEKINFQSSTATSIYDEITLNENTFIYVFQILSTFIILFITFFVIILTPLILIYFWNKNYLNYRKINTLIYSLKDKSENLPKSLVSLYGLIFSNMFAYGFGILSWILSSYFYISINYNQLSVGLLDYLNFPIKLFSAVTNDAITIQNAIPLEVWGSMLLIVGISILFFFLGRFIGKTTININYKKFLFLITKPQVAVRH